MAASFETRARTAFDVGGEFVFRESGETREEANSAAYQLYEETGKDVVIVDERHARYGMLKFHVQGVGMIEVHGRLDDGSEQEKLRQQLEWQYRGKKVTFKGEVEKRRR